MPETLPTRKGDAKFLIYTGALKAYEGDEGAKRLSTTASSSVEDLHGDTMTAECVRDMAEQAKAKGMTIFLNHRYAVPEDVMGTTVDTRSVSRAAEADGTAIWDFDLDLEVNEENPRALATYAAIKGREGRKGVKLGVSIGANITEWEFKDEKQGWWGGLTIKAVNLLEASVVGIPANPRSWVQNGVMALKTAYGVPLDDSEVALTDEAGPLLAPIDEAELVAGAIAAIKEMPADGIVKIGTEVKEGDTATLTVEADGTSSITVEKQGLAEAAEPETDTESASDGAEETDPAPEGESTESGADATAEETTSSADVPDETAGEVDLDAAKAAAQTLEESGDSSLVKELLGSLIAAAEKAIAERDAARNELAESKKLLADAAEIIAIIANTPLGRKTAFAGPVKQFTQRFAGIYDSEFLTLMERD